MHESATPELKMKNRTMVHHSVALAAATFFASPLECLAVLLYQTRICQTIQQHTCMNIYFERREIQRRVGFNSDFQVARNA